ncbi:hypothetical protein QYF36_011960 [Acer negundo]|nr:hypothetical protein QYF36_011960 [Acer negundo]
MIPTPTNFIFDDDLIISTPQSLTELPTSTPLENHELTNTDTVPSNHMLSPSPTPSSLHRHSTRPTKRPTFLQNFHVEATLPSKPEQSSASSVVIKSGDISLTINYWPRFIKRFECKRIVCAHFRSQQELKTLMVGDEAVVDGGAAATVAVVAAHLHY